jgi:hypothetical protein
MTYIQTPIKTLNDVRGFFFQLEQDDKLFHPEDNPESVINRQGKPLFSPSECIDLRERINEVYKLIDDPCDYILSFIN